MVVLKVENRLIRAVKLDFTDQLCPDYGIGVNRLLNPFVVSVRRKYSTLHS